MSLLALNTLTRDAPAMPGATTRQLLTAADDLAGRFAARAAEHDRDATFPHDNYADLAEAGLLRMSVPTELGGSGAGMGDVVAVLEKLATGDGATALAATMHLSPMGQWAQVWRRTGTSGWPGCCAGPPTGRSCGRRSPASAACPTT